jgi:hypothetical protein
LSLAKLFLLPSGGRKERTSMRDFLNGFPTSIAALLLFSLVLHAVSISTTQKPERFWLARRYDGNRVLVYFDPVKFDGTLPSNSPKLPGPVTRDFFALVQLSPDYVARFQNSPGAEHFTLGDTYDLLTGGGNMAEVTLTTLVGAESDEAVGNDSFIGALATLKNEAKLTLSKQGYYVLRRHQSPGKSQHTDSPNKPHAGLLDEPVQFDIQSKIVSLITKRAKVLATESQRHQMESVSPGVAVQEFCLADGSLRYYARAAWTSENGSIQDIPYALAAWIAPSPNLHIAAEQARTTGYNDFDGVLPDLLNVVGLANGRTAIIVLITGDDGAALRLLEYHEGADLQHMVVLQSIEVGE